MKKRIAVIGGGIFGINIALKICKDSKVDLYEKNSDILKETTSSNQFRLHRGYHYPRSPKTVMAALKSEKKFRDLFHEAVIKSGKHYYVIAKKNSFVTAGEFLNFCKKFNLEVEEANLKVLDKSQVSLIIKAKEFLYDPITLGKICWAKLRKANINVLLNEKADRKILDKYDLIIVATYSKLNDFLEKNNQNNYQFEICEKPIVSLPKEFRSKNIVVMDGPFMCIDTYGKTENFLMGNVVHAIHSRNIGKFPKIPNNLQNYINKGPITNPSITNFNKFISSGSMFFPSLKKAKHIASMFTIRCVLPYVEKTDERPSIVKKTGNIITVFSGKVADSVTAAEMVEKAICE